MRDTRVEKLEGKLRNYYFEMYIIIRRRLLITLPIYPQTVCNNSIQNKAFIFHISL
jgi:hypothetical protein